MRAGKARREAVIKAGSQALASVWLACATLSCQHLRGGDDREPVGKTTAARESRTYAFECGANIGFTARVDEHTAWLFLPRHSVQLPRDRSAAGEQYASASTRFSLSGQSAALEADGGQRLDCKNNPEQAVWERARLNGADFRATGNEPGWHLEITLGKSMILVTDYGASSYRFDTPEGIVDQAGRTTIYTTQRGKHRIVVNLQGKPCIDSMSGRRFDVTTIVQLDDRHYRGCGKALH